jgi:uncharacterized protein YllA (UPF0747 family)
MDKANQLLQRLYHSPFTFAEHNEFLDSSPCTLSGTESRLYYRDKITYRMLTKIHDMLFQQGAAIQQLQKEVNKQNEIIELMKKNNELLQNIIKTY